MADTDQLDLSQLDPSAGDPTQSLPVTSNSGVDSSIGGLLPMLAQNLSVPQQVLNQIPPDIAQKYPGLQQNPVALLSDPDVHAALQTLEPNWANDPNGMPALAKMAQQSQNTQIQLPQGANPSETSIGQDPGNNWLQYGGRSLPQVQSEMEDQIGDLKKMLDPSNESNKSLQEGMKRVAYTPEMRAQDIMDNIMGTTHTPILDNQGKPVIGPNGQPMVDTKHNWFKQAVSMLGEAALGMESARNRIPYTPLRERVAEQATKEYTAEANPVMRDMLYETRLKQNALTNISNLSRTINTGVIAGRNQDIKQEQVDAYKQRIAALDKLTDPRVALLNAQAKVAMQQGDYVKAKAITEQNEQQFLQARVQEANQNIKYQGMNGVQRAAAYAQDLRTQGRGPEADAFEQGIQRMYMNTHPETYSTVQSGNQLLRIGGRYNDVLNMPGVGQGGGMNAAGRYGPSGMTAEQMVPAAGPSPIPGLSTDRRAPESIYGSNFQQTTAPLTQQWSDTPKDSNANNDALLRYEKVGKFSQQDQNVMQGAVQLQEESKDYASALQRVMAEAKQSGSAAFGTFRGNLNKFLIGKANLSDLGPVSQMSPQMQNDLSYMKNKAGVIAISHIKAQGRISTPLVQDVQDEINSWGSTPGAILSALQAYTEKGGEAVRAIPGSKEYTAPLISMQSKNGEGYRSFQHMYDPTQYANWMINQAKAEDLKRQAAKTKGATK